jgi:hypothetical protein
MMLRKLILICSIFLFSCGNKQAIPAGILKPAVMQKVMWDVLRADAFTFDFIKRDSTKRTEAENVKLQQQIFAIHKVSKEDFYKSYNYYKVHPDLMQPILDSMINKATRDKMINTRGKKDFPKAE